VVRAKRLFVSLDFPVAVAELLVRLNPSVPGVRWLAADQIHLTLAFLGNVAAAAEEKLCANFRAIQFTSFFLPLQGVGSFPARGQPKIIWIGVGRGHPHLFQLHKRVTDAALAAGLDADLRPWRPHVTLARCDKVSAQSIRPFLRAEGDFDAGLVSIDAFQLKSSLLTPGGSIHTTELLVPSAR
jgi:RNA 2',3'-cyclic 3'-phosphodiesterase